MIKRALRNDILMNDMMLTIYVTNNIDSCLKSRVYIYSDRCIVLGNTLL